ncbi:MAG: FAD-dependent oxidoreductase [Lachnospiraceae bacterium]|nr:FAD-dependent oxidoreductase [Lachnospiraceae bacterium]
MRRTWDAVILGAGLYGLYAARLLAGHGKKCLVLEIDETAMRRATWINQARVHNGYHYPRSLSTALKSAHYYRRFHEDYDFCIRRDFRQIYATSAQFSWTDREQFMAFCAAAGIPCSELPVRDYFVEGLVDGAYLTEEDTYDAGILRDFYMKELQACSDRVTLVFGARTNAVDATDGTFILHYAADGSGEEAQTDLLINATYASANQVLALVNESLRRQGAEELPLFGIKYELCEIILCEPSDRLRDIGITVMDGPFFSIMPFGRTGLHSLTAVTHTPHVACREDLPVFPCQEGTDCSPAQLMNCNDCPHKPASAWPYMRHLADKYLLPELAYSYHSSLFSMKPILRSTEVDDARPTTIRTDPVNGARMVSALSGKINTVYDLDEVLL